MGIRRGVSWHKLMVDLSFLRRKARQRPPWFHSPAARYTPRVSVPTADCLRTQPARTPQCRLPRFRSQAEDLPPLDAARIHLFRTPQRLRKGFSLGTTQSHRLPQQTKRAPFCTTAAQNSPPSVIGTETWHRNSGPPHQPAAILNSRRFTSWKRFAYPQTQAKAGPLSHNGGSGGRSTRMS